MDVEIIGEAAIDVAFEQQRQGDAGDRKRDGDGGRSAGDEPQAQRSRRHSAGAGNR